MRLACLAMVVGAIFAVRPLRASELIPLPLSGAEAARRLAPLLATGDVLLLEPTPSGTFSQATVFANLPIPAAQAYGLIADPSNYMRMSPSIDAIEVHERTSLGALFTSSIRVPFGHISTTVRMTFAGKQVIETRFAGGDLKTGSFRWQFVPDGGKSQAIYSLKTDIGESSWMVRKMVKARPEMQFGGNAGTGLVTVWGLRRMASRQPAAGVSEPSPWRDKPVELPPRLSGTSEAWTALAPLLQRGPLVHIDSTPGGRLRRVTVFGRVHADEAHIYGIISDPTQYPKFLTSLKKLTITGSTGPRIRYSSVAELMTLQYRQSEEVLLEPRRVHQRVLEGDLKGSASLMELLPLSDTDTLVAYSFFLDPTRSGWIMRKIYSLDPVIEHTMSVAGGVNIYLGLARLAEGRPAPGPEEG